MFPLLFTFYLQNRPFYLQNSEPCFDCFSFWHLSEKRRTIREEDVNWLPDRIQSNGAGLSKMVNQWVLSLSTQLILPWHEGELGCNLSLWDLKAHAGAVPVEFPEPLSRVGILHINLLLIFF